MKQLVILSGKGGTGKTSVAAAFSHMAVEGPDQISTVLTDADVDASNLELLLAPRVLEREDFWGGQVAVINHAACISGGDCVEVCRFDAIYESYNLYHVDPIACEGCASCMYQCPRDAITMEKQIAGQWFRSESRFGPLFHAELYPAQENSGKLVTLIKQHARLMALDEGYELVIVDGPPGIGCPVISAASGADLALIIAEPSAAGVHDLQRILKTTEHFGVRALVCINKADLYPEGAAEITSFCQDHNFEVVGTIPYDIGVTEAITQGKPVTAYQTNGIAAQALREVWVRTVDAIRESR
jgi:MinD superfamily P-loop ATPase